MRISRPAIFVVAAQAGLIAVPAAAQPTLAPHRAVYDIALDDASDRSGITDINGRMVYEFNGSECEGYTVTFRFVTRIDTSEVSRVTDQQTTTYEDPEGTSFDFATKSFIDNALDKEIRGTARISDGSTVVEMEKPQDSEVVLDPTQFPTQHLVELLERARAGDTFYETNLFDGSDDADKIMTTTVIIGQQGTASKDDDGSRGFQSLEAGKYWPVSIAYFDMSDENGEEVPDYRIDFKLHENGITRDLVMDYGDFSMKGKLVDLAVFDDAKACARQN